MGPHMHEETKAHRGEVTCPRSHELMVEAGRELRSPVFSPVIFPLSYHAILSIWFTLAYTTLSLELKLLL